MSANEQKDTVFQAIKGGAEEYLVKPVTKKEVQNIWQYVWKRLKAAQLQAEMAQLQADALPPQQPQQPVALSQVGRCCAGGWVGCQTVSREPLLYSSVALLLVSAAFYTRLAIC
jgi:hypothetical protein